MSVNFTGDLVIDYKGYHVELEKVLSEDPGIDGYYVLKSGPEFLKDVLIMNENKVKGAINQYELQVALATLDERQLHHLGFMVLETVLYAVREYTNIRYNYAPMCYLSKSSYKLPKIMKENDSEALRNCLFDVICDLRSIRGLSEVMRSDPMLLIDSYLERKS